MDVDIRTLNPKIMARGREFFASISGEAPSVFNKSWWTGKVMDWAMHHEEFKVQLFRFMDVLPYLNTSESLHRHIREYFGAEDQEMPGVLKWGIKGAGFGKAIAGKLMDRTIRSNIESMARQFIIGENARQAVKTLNKLRKDGFAATVDILGEATVSEPEGELYQRMYLDLLDALAKEQDGWKTLGSHDNGLDWGVAPKVNVSIKPSALYSQARPQDFQGTVAAICDRLRPVVEKVVSLQGFLRIDMEQYKYKDITLEVYKRLRMEDQFRGYENIGLVLQSYLKDTDRDLEQLLAWADAEDIRINVRLVKGAYWDYETVIAKQSGWEVPVYTVKPETDAAFERQSKVLLARHDCCFYACGSHNIRSIAAVMELARAMNVPEDRYEFQVLFGMAEPVRKGLRNVAGRVRLYAPYGELLPGMAYLVRRLLENTANESFLRQSFAEHEDKDHLLEDPQILADQERAARQSARPSQRDGFVNEPFADFTKAEEREAFPAAIREVRDRLGRTVPLYIGGEEVLTEDRLTSVNPADPNEVLGHVCQAGGLEVDQAIAAARQAFPGWRDLHPQDRAGYLFKAADIARKDIYRLSAWQVLEVGKQWAQAHADVGEAIDFMEYYARDMIRLGTPRRMGNAPGEVNHSFYQPKGIAAVIAPWNFPLAISCGMTSAAMVTGNCVLYKPSGLSSMIGQNLCDIYRRAGIPQGVFNFVPGRGNVIGDHLVEHPDIALIAFTGSLEVGLRIIERASRVQPGQEVVKKVITEMGGKNGIIVDDDADLDEAVLDIVYSAFGFQGQKCSACSRVIVLDAIYDRFMTRLREAAQSIKIGPASDPANFMGPVVDAAARDKILEYIGVGEQEGKLVLKRDDLPAQGFYVPLTIIEGITPAHRLAQEEIFGPVLAVMRVKNLDQALKWANSTQQALTGGVFSRSPLNLEQARRTFRVGNLYLNRGTTGALVGRQPFGGFKMSGVGSKTGGPDYLIQFMDPRCVTENTMRRGFAPIEEEDDWVE